MVRLGTDHGVATIAQLTSMNAPLGRAVGQRAFRSERVGLTFYKDTDPVSSRVGLALARSWSNSWASTSIPNETGDGSGYEVYQRMIRAQDGDPDATLPVAACRDDVVSPEEGVVHSIDPSRSVSRRGDSVPVELARRIPVSAAAGVVCLVREAKRSAKANRCSNSTPRPSAIFNRARRNRQCRRPR